MGQVGAGRQRDGVSQGDQMVASGRAWGGAHGLVGAGLWQSPDRVYEKVRGTVGAGGGAPAEDPASRTGPKGALEEGGARRWAGDGADGAEPRLAQGSRRSWAKMVVLRARGAAGVQWEGPVRLPPPLPGPPYLGSWERGSTPKTGQVKPRELWEAPRKRGTGAVREPESSSQR